MIVATVTGRLGKDAEIRSTQGGSVLKFSIASGKKSRDGETTTWVECSLWGKRGEALVPYLTKGTAVACVGELSMRDHNGKTYIDLKVSELDFMGGKSSGGTQHREERHAPSDASDNDIPF